MSRQPDLRGALVEATRRLIARCDTADLTVREVAAEAGLAVGLLYNHFTDKGELLALGLRAHVAAVVAALGPPPGPAGTATVETHLQGFVDRALALHARILPAYASVLDQPAVLTRAAALAEPDGPPLRREVVAYLREEQAVGRIATGAEVEVAATMLVGACHELVLPHLYRGAPASELAAPPGFAEALVATLLRGISPSG